MVYPFHFYILSMFSFYLFSKEFLNNQALRILSGTLYVINPVTPYYYASLINAFSLVMLPLAFKFFTRSLKEINNQQKPKVLKNIGITAFFLALTISANEQFILSAALIGAFFIISLMFFAIKKYKLTRQFLTLSALNGCLFIAVIFLINIPLIVSLYNVQSAPLSTYFQGPEASRFLQTVDFTYLKSNPITLLRLGGYAGLGLGTTSWYDSNIVTNLFGYVLFGVFLIAVINLVKYRKRNDIDKHFLLQCSLLFVIALALILSMKTLASASSEYTILDLIFKTWETPAKLRVVLLISMLATILGAFALVEQAPKPQKKKLIAIVVVALIATTLVYNSPWLIGQAGNTTLNEVAQASNWKSLYDSPFIQATNSLDQTSTDERAIIIPYTHKAELYSQPNSRIFQIVSSVNDATTLLTPQNNLSWSKTLGLFSINSVALLNRYNSKEILIFPQPLLHNMNETIDNLRNDKDLQLQNSSNSSDYQIYNNPNALPLIYASNNYVIYDSISTVKDTFNFVNFTDLPVFLGQNTLSQIEVPDSIDQGLYNIHMIGLQNQSHQFSLRIENKTGSTNIKLFPNEKDEYSLQLPLSPGDKLSLGDPQEKINKIGDLTLNSSTYSLGTRGNFKLNFTVNILQDGNSSFLSPRILLNTGEQTYFIILHDDGFVELAKEENNHFQSSVLLNQVGYSLKDKTNSIYVQVERLIDQVNVFIDGKLSMNFPIESTPSDVSLVSEQCVSKFSNIYLTEIEVARLFAIRENPTKIDYKTTKVGAEESSISISTDAKNFAVVSQYLQNNLRHAKSSLPSNSSRANVFFTAWFFNPPQKIANNEITLTIDTKQPIYVITLVSIISTYAIILYIIMPGSFKKSYKTLQKTLRRQNDARY